MLMANSFDYASRYADARKDIASWLKEGSLKRRFHMVKGLENAPQAVNLLFSGGNTGKLCVFIFPRILWLAEMGFISVVQVSDIPTKL